nr:FecR domain-containing protein [Fodinibius salsisoli]
MVVLGSLYFSYDPEEPVQKEGPTFLTRSTAFGEKRLLTLSDGSTVQLNANSTLKLPESPAGDLQLWLKGEAYFNIVHKKGAQKRTVTVHTPDGNVQVLGTKFNVNTFNKGTEVVLKEGKVRVGVIDKTGHYRANRTMKPGELSQFTAEHEEILITQVNPELYTSWTDDKLIFDHTPIVDVAERIEHIYGVELVMMDHEIGETEISGSIPNDNLPIFLQALEKILQQPITRKKGVIQIGSPGK